MEIQNIILIAVLAVLVIAAVVFIIRHKSISKCAFCNGNCENCRSVRKSIHANNEEKSHDNQKSAE